MAIPAGLVDRAWESLVLRFLEECDRHHAELLAALAEDFGFGSGVIMSESEERLRRQTEFIKGATRRILAEIRSEQPALAEGIVHHPRAAVRQLLPVFSRRLYQAMVSDGGPFGPAEKRAGFLRDRLFADLERHLEAVAALAGGPYEAVCAAMAGEQWDTAEAIIRGQLALDGSDFEMINNLFTVGCLAGRAELIVEARRLGQVLVDQQQATAGTVSSYHLEAFLKRAVLENFVLGADDLRSAGGIILPRGGAEPDREAFRGDMEQLKAMIVEDVERHLLASPDWTADSFVGMCRRVVWEKCRAYAQWVPGLLVLPHFKGEPPPVPEALRDCLRQL